MDLFLTEADISENKTLELFDFNSYINREKLHEVKNAVLLSLNDKNSFDPEGLWSETIFGRIGSKERKLKFGYIKLNIPMIRPVIYKLLRTYSDQMREILLETAKFTIDDSGKLIYDNVNGETGLLFLLNNYKKIDFEKCSKRDKQLVGQFFNTHKDKVFLDNYWIIPPGGIRDMSVNRNIKQFSSEINDIYEKIISLNDQIILYEFDDDMKQILALELQKCLIQAHVWVQNKMTGKSGLLRGTMLKKSVDYTARIIAMSDPSIPFGSVGISWHAIIVLYEPFVFHYILKVKPEIQEQIKLFLKIEHTKPLNASELKKFTNAIQLNPESIPIEIKDIMVECAKYVTKDKDILIKRDPVMSRGNYFAASIIVLTSGRGIVVNPLNCGPLTLDFDGDCLAAYPAFTEESLKEVKKLNPSKNKSIWVDLKNSGQQNFNLQLDAISTIYHATKTDLAV